MALTRFRDSEGAPDRRILGAAASDKDALGSLRGLEGYLTAAWHGTIFMAKGDDERESPYCELKWEIPVQSPP